METSARGSTWETLLRDGMHYPAALEPAGSAVDVHIVKVHGMTPAASMIAQWSLPPVAQKSVHLHNLH